MTFYFGSGKKPLVLKIGKDRKTVEQCRKALGFRGTEDETLFQKLKMHLRVKTFNQYTTLEVFLNQFPMIVTD